MKRPLPLIIGIAVAVLLSFFLVPHAIKHKKPAAVPPIVCNEKLPAKCMLLYNVHRKLYIIKTDSFGKSAETYFGNSSWGQYFKGILDSSNYASIDFAITFSDSCLAKRTYNGWTMRMLAAEAALKIQMMQSAQEDSLNNDFRPISDTIYAKRKVDGKVINIGTVDGDIIIK